VTVGPLTETVYTPPGDLSRTPVYLRPGYQRRPEIMPRASSYYRHSDARRERGHVS
jgi:hypothetical protein